MHKGELATRRAMKVGVASDHTTKIGKDLFGLSARFIPEFVDQKRV